MKKTVVIVGGGFSGVATAAQLLRRAEGPLRVVLVERRAALGGGAAYGTRSDVHWLNVPAENMSAFPDDPGHFLRWLGGSPGTFAKRKDYARYLRRTLSEAARGARPGVTLETATAEAVSARPEKNGARVVLAGGRGLRADRVVLALGHPPPAFPAPRENSFHGSSRYIHDPWAPGALKRVKPGDGVLLVGTGLTMADQVLALRERGHRGAIFAVSRRGLPPRAHAPYRPPPPRAAAEFPLTALGLLRDVRRRVRAGEDWRAAVDSLRPATQELWRRLPDKERRRFLRHLRPYWDAHRHRIAPEAGRRLKASRLRVLAGRVQSFQESARGVAVAILPRAGKKPRVLNVGAVVNCTGPRADHADAHPLLRGLRDAGVIVPHPLGPGLSLREDGALIGKNGKPSSVFFALGPARTGLLWESVAVPELREQAEALARRLLAGLHASRGGYNAQSGSS